jgi:hypothetical protein
MWHRGYHYLLKTHPETSYPEFKLRYVLSLYREITTHVLKYSTPEAFHNLPYSLFLNSLALDFVMILKIPINIPLFCLSKT